MNYCEVCVATERAVFGLGVAVGILGSAVILAVLG